MENEGLFYILLVIFSFILIAYILGVRDAKLAKKNLIYKLKKNWGDSPKRNYKEDDFDHIPGYYDNHKTDFQIDDTTWNDLNMDGVFTRMNYCLSASGEEYLYYMLRTPKQTDDFEEEEKKVKFFSEDDDARLKCQIALAKIGRGSRFSIYEYLKQLENIEDFSNKKHYMMLTLMIFSIGLMFVSFQLGFVMLLAVAATNIFMYFRIKNKIDPYLATYGYILKVLDSTKLFKSSDYPAISDDIEALGRSYDNMKGFSSGSSILMSPSGTGNPADIILDYYRMLTHVDLIKFNKMYIHLMEKKDELDKIITVIGKIDAYISIACYRESVKEQYCIPVFEGKDIKCEEVIHPFFSNTCSSR